MAFDPSKYVDAQGNPLDPALVAFAKSIKTVESAGDIHAVGASGEKGAYQWMPGNFESGAKRHGLDPTDFSLENQNRVAYLSMAEDKDNGLQPFEIAAKWNSGSPDNWRDHASVNQYGVKYDTPAYVKKVMDTFTLERQGLGAPPAHAAGPESALGGLPPITPTQEADIASQGQYGALFPSRAGEGPLSAAAKTVANLPTSAFHFAKGVIDTLNPLNTINNLAQIPGAFSSLVQESGGVGNALKAFGSEVLPTTYQAVVPEAGRGLIQAAGGGFTGNEGAIDEGLQRAQRAITNDPVGQIAPFVFAAQGAAKLSDKVGFTKDAAGALDRGISRTGQIVTKPVGYAFGKVADAVRGAAEYGTAKVTGLNPETMREVVRNPAEFTKENMATMSRKTLGEEIASKLDERVDVKAETGRAYKPVRESTTPVKVDKTFLKDTLSKETGLDFKKGRFTPNAKSFIDKPTDVAAVQRLYDAWQPYFNKGVMTADDFLAFRSKLAKLAYNEAGIRSGDMAQVGNGTRVALNTTYRGQIKGLEDLDSSFASQAAEFKNLKKGLIDRDGNLTDTAINRIANATGKGKDQFLGRLEEISPGITHKIRVLKAVEDIQNIHKVGTYTKGGVEILGGGGLAGGIITGNIPVIVASITGLLLAQPEIAVRVLRGYGEYAKPLAGKVLDAIKTGGAQVNNITEPSKTVFGRDIKNLREPSRGPDFAAPVSANPVSIADQHITTANMVVKNLPKAELDALGGMKGLIAKTQNDIAAGLTGEGFVKEGTAVSALNVSKVANLNALKALVDSIVRETTTFGKR